MGIHITWFKTNGFTLAHKPWIPFTVLAYFYANKQIRNPFVSILIINLELWWVGWQKSAKSPTRCVSAGCPCTTEDSESQFADFSTKNNPGIYDTNFGRFLYCGVGDFISGRENQHRHIYDS
jgi:hypothetical protein